MAPSNIENANEEHRSHWYKYDRNYKCDTMMPELLEPDELLDHQPEDQTQEAGRADLQRQRLRLCLDEIASEVSTSLRDAKLTMPVFFCVPSSGAALLSFCTPDDPSDEDWSTASEIIGNIVGDKIGIRVGGRSLACAASGLPVVAVDVTDSSG